MGESCGLSTNLHIAWQRPFRWPSSRAAPARVPVAAQRARSRARPSSSTRCRPRTRPALYIAYDDGLFAKQGLTVKIAPINGGEYGMGDLQTGKAAARRGQLRLVRARPGRGHVRGARPERIRPRPPQPVKPIDMQHHRRLVADAAGQPGAVRDAELAATRRWRTWPSITRRSASTRCNNIGSVLLGSLLAANGFKLSVGHAGAGRSFRYMPTLLSPAQDRRGLAARAVRHRGRAGVRGGAAGRLRPGRDSGFPHRHRTASATRNG